ncbi:MAG: hypothetical protein ACFFDI_17880 [Promethearchaeota archaeon]
MIIRDDDTTAPELMLRHTGNLFDGDPGFLEFSITETDPGSHATGTLTILGPYNFFWTHNYGECAETLNLKNIGVFELEEYNVILYAENNDEDRGEFDEESTSNSIHFSLTDDDTTPPEVANPSIEDDILILQVSFDAIDDSSGDDNGIGVITIFVDGELKVVYYPTESEIAFTFALANEWILELGTHDVKIEIWDADDDRVGDSLVTAITGTFEITFDEIKQYVSWEIDQLIEKVQWSPDDSWAKKNSKMVMIAKLTELKELLSCNDFANAYDKLLHDIKPKLTGLKTNEHEEPWGNGVFNNPWVISEELQEEFQWDCNDILSHLQLLLSLT